MVRVRIPSVALAGLAVAVLVLVLGGCNRSGRGIKAYCDSVRSGEDPLLLFDRYDPSSADRGQAALDQAVERLHEIEGRAPVEVDEALRTLVDAAEQLAAALHVRTGADGSDATSTRSQSSSPSQSESQSAVSPQSSSAAGTAATAALSIDAGKVTSASGTVTRFTTDRCGVSLGATGPSNQPTG
jgi:hypothetical protein